MELRETEGIEAPAFPGLILPIVEAEATTLICSKTDIGSGRSISEAVSSGVGLGGRGSSIGVALSLGLLEGPISGRDEKRGVKGILISSGKTGLLCTLSETLVTGYCWLSPSTSLPLPMPFP